MPSLKIDLGPGAWAALKVLVRRDNAANSLDLSLEEWATLHFKEMAIAEQLTARLEEIRKKAEKVGQAALDAAVKKERDGLLAALD